MPSDRGQLLDQVPPDAAAAVGLVHGQLVEEHLGALVGVGDFDPADEADRPWAVVGHEEVVAVVGQERAVASGRAGPSKRWEAAATRASSPGPSSG